MSIKIETAGFKRWAEVMLFEGRDRDGTNIGRPGFRNVLTGQEVIPPEGWDGDLSKLDHGDLACVISTSEKYRRGYEAINWEKGDEASKI
jgi:hypothetical protein